MIVLCMYHKLIPLSKQQSFQFKDSFALYMLFINSAEKEIILNKRHQDLTRATGINEEDSLHQVIWITA